MKIFIILMAIYFFNSNALAGIFESRVLTESEEKQILKAISLNDLATVQKYLKDKPSLSNSGSFDGDGGQLLLWFATSTSAWKKYEGWVNENESQNFVCRPEIVKYLIDEGVKPTEQFFSRGDVNNGHLTGAIRAGCVPVVKLLLEQMTQKDITEASKRFRMDVYGNIYGDEKKQTKVAEVGKALVEYNKKYCEQGNESSCEAKAHVVSSIKEFIDEAEQYEYSNSKEGQTKALESKICATVVGNANFKEKMKEEREKAKISGFIDKLKMKNWGDNLYLGEKLQKKYISEYKTITGKSFNLKKCEK